jgi:hypothetical protein
MEGQIMVVQTEFFGKVFDQAFEGFRKATESSLHLQQDMFRQWVTFWPGFPKPQGDWAERVKKFQKEWTQTVTEMTRKFQETWESQYKASLELLTEAFKVAEAKEPEELRKKTEEMWKKTFDCLKGLAEAQMQNFQAASEKWIEMMTKVNA